MRILVLGGTRFIGRRIVERLGQRDDRILVVHRGLSEPEVRGPEHLHTARADLARHADSLRACAPDSVVDTYALTRADVEAVRPILADLPAVVLSSQDVYAAVDGLRGGVATADVPITEDSPLRAVRYPYRGSGAPGIPDDYDKLDVEEAWAGATVLRLPMVYGPFDEQRREGIVLRRVRAGRSRMPVGSGSLLWTRAHVDDVASAVLAALDAGCPPGPLNIGERTTPTLGRWVEAIRDAAGARLELVRVPDPVLPPDLALLAAPTQHLLTDSQRAGRVLGWTPGDPSTRLEESVRWHLAHPPDDVWTDEDTVLDDRALAAAS